MSAHVLVVGCGSIGERHLRTLLHTGRARVAACDTKPELLEQTRLKYQVPCFPTLAAALAAQKFDGVVICTPAHTHIAVASAAIRSGAGLLIEKPLSIGFEGLDELRQEIVHANKFVGIAYVYHFMPAIQAARAFLQTGVLGKPLHVIAISGQHFPTFRPAYRDIYYNRHETGGGAIQDALTHLINAVEWFVGPTTRLYCEAAHQALEGVTVEDTAIITARSDAVVASYSLNQFQTPNETSIEIHCELGSLRIEAHAQRWGTFPRGATEWEFRSAPVKHRDDYFLAQSHAFLDGLEGKPNPLCTFAEAVQTLKCNVAALKSARTGQAVIIA